MKAFFFILCLISSAVFSATITDKLTVNVFSTPSVTAQVLQQLSTGTPIELLEEKEGFVKIQLLSGEAGWVEKKWVQHGKVASAKLLELQSKYRTLQNQFDQLEADFKQLAENDGAGLVQENSALKADNAQLNKALAEYSAQAETAEQHKKISWSWLLISAFPCLLLGGAVGALWRDKWHRKRHGGFRV